MTQKLDSFSKILLATVTINYLASMLDGVNSDMKFIPDPDKVHAEGIQKRQVALENAVEKLKEVMNELGDAMDAVCPIDEYVTEPAFNVLCHGHDNVEGDFENVD
jgi:hypothetical protein